MIRRGNGMIVQTQSTNCLMSLLGGLELEIPHYESLPDRIERLKLQQKRHEKDRMEQTNNRNHLEEYLAQSQLNSTQSKLRQNRSQSPIIPAFNPSSTTFTSKELCKVPRRSMENLGQFQLTIAPLRNPEAQKQIRRSQSVDRLPRHSMDTKQNKHHQQMQLVRQNTPVRRNLVAGRIYCKEQLMTPIRQPTSRIRRVPIQNLRK